MWESDGQLTIDQSGNISVGEQEYIIPSDGLISWWTADGNTDDRVGGNHGQLQDGATFGPGIVGQAFSLDGLDDHVAIRINLPVAMEEISVGAWVNYASFPTYTRDYPIVVVRRSKK